MTAGRRHIEDPAFLQYVWAAPGRHSEDVRLLLMIDCVAAGRRHMLYRAFLRFVWAAPGKHGTYAHMRPHSAAFECTAHPSRTRHAAVHQIRTAQGHFCSMFEPPRTVSELVSGTLWPISHSA